MYRPHADVTFTAVVFIVAVLALAFGGWLIADPPIPLGRDILAMSPRVFPTLILIGTAVVSFAFLATAYRDGTLIMDEVEAAARNRAALYRQVLFVVITVGCAMLLTTLGFLTTMFLLMASTAVLVGNRNVWQTFSISIVVPLAFYIIVTHVLRTELPEADFIERALQPFIQLLPTV
ncbi:MAG TPA: tripartite tricarboxylate transporter TctB family protein [Gammaproteobacteria bacterium]